MKNCLMRVVVGCPFERCRGVEFGLLRALLGGIIAFHAKDDQYDKHMLKLGDTSVCCQNNIRIGEAWFRRCGQNVAMNRKCWNGLEFWGLADVALFCECLSIRNVNIGRLRGHVATVAPRCIFAVSIVMAFPHHVVEAPGLQRNICVSSMKRGAGGRISSETRH